MFRFYLYKNGNASFMPINFVFNKKKSKTITSRWFLGDKRSI